MILMADITGESIPNDTLNGEQSTQSSRSLEYCVMESNRERMNNLIRTLRCAFR